MLKKIFVGFIAGLLLNLAIAPSVLASDESENAAAFARKVKSEVARLGIGPKAKTTVILKDGTKIKGHISQTGDDEFTVKNGEKDTNISYTAVNEMKGKRSIGGIGKTLLIVGIVIAVTVIIVAIKYKNAEDNRPVFQ